MSVVQLRRAFIREFSGWKSYRDVPQANAFSRLIKRLQESGGTTGRSKEPESSNIMAANISRMG